MERLTFQRFPLAAGHPVHIRTGHGSAAVTGADVNRMTRSQREALERQALHGAKISF